MHWFHRSGALFFVVSLGAFIPSEAGAQGLGDSDSAAPGWNKEASTQLALRFADRPLTLPEDVFDIRFDGAATQISDRYALIALGAGAGYGITDDMEIGLALLRLTLSDAPDTGLDLPTGYLQYRLINTAFQLSVRADVELPGRGPIELAVRIPMMLRMGRFMRIDTTLSALSETVSPWPLRLVWPLIWSFQITDAFRMGAVAQVDMPNVRDESMMLNLGGELVYTFGDSQGASAELAFGALSPGIALVGDRPADPALGKYFQAGVTFRMFFKGGAISTPGFDAFD